MHGFEGFHDEQYSIQIELSLRYPGHRARTSRLLHGPACQQPGTCSDIGRATCYRWTGTCHRADRQPARWPVRSARSWGLKWRQQIEASPVHLAFGAVDEVSRFPSHWEARLCDERSFKARALVAATGSRECLLANIPWVRGVPSVHKDCFLIRHTWSSSPAPKRS